MQGIVHVGYVTHNLFCIRFDVSKVMHHIMLLYDMIFKNNADNYFQLNYLSFFIFLLKHNIAFIS